MSEAGDVLRAVDQLRRDLSGYHGQLKAHNDLSRHCEYQRQRIAELEGLHARDKAENAKLRELCHRALVVLENNCSQCVYFYECDIGNDCKCIAPMHIREELRELGVEKGA